MSRYLNARSRYARSTIDIADILPHHPIFNCDQKGSKTVGLMMYSQSCRTKKSSKATLRVMFAKLVDYCYTILLQRE